MVGQFNLDVRQNSPRSNRALIIRSDVELIPFQRSFISLVTASPNRCLSKHYYAFVLHVPPISKSPYRLLYIRTCGQSLTHYLTSLSLLILYSSRGGGGKTYQLVKRKSQLNRTLNGRI